MVLSGNTHSKAQQLTRVQAAISAVPRGPPQTMMASRLPLRELNI